MTRPLLEDLDTPAPVIDLDIMQHNLERMAELCRSHGVALRPHTKTHKTPELAQKQMALGASGITVAKLGEAEVMAAHGLDDILVAYEVVGASKMRRLTDLLSSRRDLKLTIAVDSVQGAAALSDAATAAGSVLPVMIEIDSGGGRAGVAGVDGAVSLARQIRLFPGLFLSGIMTHEGQVYREEPGGIKLQTEKVADRMAEIAAAIRSLGLPCAMVSVGSTPGAPYLAGAPGIGELRPGTYIFNDRTQVAIGAAAESDCALTVLSTVISVQPGSRAILDAGSKALTSDAFAKFESYGAVLGDPGARLTGISEEHGHLDITGSSRSYSVGDRVHILPNHVCPVVNLTDVLFGYRDGVPEQTWRVAARGCVR